MVHFSMEKPLFFLPSWHVFAEVPSWRSLFCKASIPLLFCEPSESKALKLPMDISFTLFVSHSMGVHVQVLEMGPSHAAFSGKVRVFAVILLGCFPLPLSHTRDHGVRGMWLWMQSEALCSFILKVATEIIPRVYRLKVYEQCNTMVFTWKFSVVMLQVTPKVIQVGKSRRNQFS